MSAGGAVSAQEMYAACGHGSDDKASCFGCEYGESIGPWREPVMRRRIQIRYSQRFVSQSLALTWPLPKESR